MLLSRLANVVHKSSARDGFADRVMSAHVAKMTVLHELSERDLVRVLSLDVLAERTNRKSKAVAQ